MVMSVCLRPFFLDMKDGWNIVCSELGQDTKSCSGELCF